MAEAGQDLLLKIFDGVQRLEGGVERLDGKVQRLEGRVERLENAVGQLAEGLRATNDRIDHTNDTLTLLGSIIHQLTQTVKGRIDNHEERLQVLETRR